jgi:eIF-2B alpha/beta/delta-like uncharacterized protein
MTDAQVKKVIQDIKDLKIQGNTNIAKTVAKTLLDYATHTKPQAFEQFIINLEKYGHDLAFARQNEPLSVNAVTFMLKDLHKCETRQQVRIKFIDRIESFFKYIDESYEIIRLNAVNLLQGHSTFFTHCHSSLARDVLIRINQISPILVINDETRPLYQGRITAEKLAKAKVNVLHTVDSAVSSVFLDPRYPKPEVALVGCDGISIHGDLINKVGTFNIALAAKAANIPLYVVAQSMKLDMRFGEGETVLIEQRSKDEVWKERPAKVDVLNPAFDFIPAEYITGGYITEKGLIQPDEFKQVIKS